jgi:hypothetical protein
MAWIQYQMWEELHEPVLVVALAKSQDAYSLVDQLWQGEDSLLQRNTSRERMVLLKCGQHRKLFIKALNAFYKSRQKRFS